MKKWFLIAALVGAGASPAQALCWKLPEAQAQLERDVFAERGKLTVLSQRETEVFFRLVNEAEPRTDYSAEQVLLLATPKQGVGFVWLVRGGCVESIPLVMGPGLFIQALQEVNKRKGK